MFSLKIALIIIALITSLRVYAEIEYPPLYLPQTPATPEENAEQQRLIQGIQLLQQGQAQVAQHDYFIKVIEYYEKKHGQSKAKLFTARSPKETVYYLLSVTGEKNISSQMVSIVYSLAYYFSGYSYIELKDPNKAKASLEKAIELAPENSLYYSELGHLYQMERNWEKSKALFAKAKLAAEFMSPDDSKNFDVLRAKRGVAYNLVELGDLDGAEKEYQECLKIDSNDTRSRNEIKYIQGLRIKNGQKKPVT